jgi:mono/diheme cytochrome c family protein
MRRRARRSVAAAVGTAFVLTGSAYLLTPAGAAGPTGVAVAPGLVLPSMDAEHGKELFAGKGCVVCHSINGVGGTDAPALDAVTMDPVMNPFDFFAKMWKGAEPMIAMQNDELGGQIEFTGQDLADIVAFVHNAAVQKTFSEDDIPADIKEHMQGDEDSGGSHMMMNNQGGMTGGGMMGGQSSGK